jgi:hypothetical protein
MLGSALCQAAVSTIPALQAAAAQCAAGAGTGRIPNAPRQPYPIFATLIADASSSGEAAHRCESVSADRAGAMD